MSDRRRLTVNDSEKQFVVNLKTATKHLEVMTNNLLVGRAESLKSLMDPTGRDYNKEFGYIDGPDIKTYMDFYRRHGIAKKVVDVYPNETWAIDPDLYETANNEKETPFETAWVELQERLNLWHYMHRADVLSGIGRYGGLFFGFSDERELKRPVPGVMPDGSRNPQARGALRLNFVRAFSEDLIDVVDSERDPRNPRYGLPTMYTLRFADPSESPFGDAPETEDFKVHWTRFQHFADNCMSSETHGMPRMEPVLDWLQDSRKVVGGSAEMFWKGAFPGYAVEITPEAGEDPDFDEETVREQFDQYMNKLKRYLALVRAKVTSLAPQVADPTAHVKVQMELIAASLDVPLRIFLGSEAAHLASTQDLVTWYRRLAKRQKVYVNPRIIRPFASRMMAAGVLPMVKKYNIDWTDLNAMSEEQKADVALKRTQAMMQYTTGGLETMMPPFHYYTLILGLSIDQAMVVMAEVKKAAALMTQDVWKQPEPTTQSGGNSGKDKTKKTNRSRNSQG